MELECNSCLLVIRKRENFAKFTSKDYSTGWKITPYHSGLADLLGLHPNTLRNKMIKWRTVRRKPGKAVQELQWASAYFRHMSEYANSKSKTLR
jgi:hypothetical protein